MARRVAAPGERLDGRFVLNRVVREHRFQTTLIERGQLAERYGRIAHAQAAVLRRMADRLAHIRAVRQLENEAAVIQRERALEIERPVKLKANAVAHGHLQYALGHAAEARRPAGQHAALADERRNLLAQRAHALGVRQAALVQLRAQAHDAGAGALELGRDNIADVRRGHRKGHQRRRDVQLLKAAAHGVLAADRAHAQTQLRVQRAQQRRHGLAPALRRAHALEILLEGQMRVLNARAAGRQLADRLDHGQIRAAIGILFGHEGIIAPAHRRAAGGPAAHNRQLGHHGLYGGELIFAAKGHQHRGRADGRIEPLGQAALGADVQIGGERPHALGKIGGNGPFVDLAAGHMGAGMALSAVGIEENARHIDDHIAVPAHHQPLFVGDARHDGGLEVLALGQRDERLNVLLGQHDRHALLRFGDGQLGAAQAVVLAGHGVQVDLQPLGQLADGHGHAARAEIVAALDELRRARIAHETLQLALLGRVALLHLRAAGFERRTAVRF